ncbi:putative glucan endo-1,3-beta-glucosidase GVI [Salvia splendens]|uniref:putative glucan endo-1,3-beta-glucosidase GVI n=1 Tax=Salvia splendens TaxID=180675 RepID=UPI001C26B3E9|nr:putative glucan endo-1,3-beta-glucosidase GVI [Salvia splendens]
MGTLFSSSLALFFTILLHNHPGGEAGVGVNYGVVANNLPPPPVALSRLRQIGITKIRIFDPENTILTALHGSDISVIIGTKNKDLLPLATDKSAASAWVAANILPHHPSVKFTCITAGNDEVPAGLSRYTPAAMENLAAAVAAANLSIPVSTVISMRTLSASFPPSAGDFSAAAKPIMTQIVKFLQSEKYPLHLQVFPYFARANYPVELDLDYALFRPGKTAVRDGGRTYLNLFDLMTDAAHAALEKIGAGELEIVAAESGWPSGGGNDATVENAQTYVNNLIGHVASGKGTPRRPGKQVEAYIFALFNENMKPEGIEQHWGMFYPNLTHVYHLNKIV